MPEDGIVSTAPETVAPAAAVVAETPATPAVADSPGEEKPATPEQAEKPAEQKKGTARFERRINRLYKEAAEQKARADLLEQQLKSSQPRSQEDGAPKLEQFDFDPEKYAQALADHKTKQFLKEQTEKQREQTFQRQQASLKASWEEKTAKAGEKYEDFDEVVGDLTPNQPWTRALAIAENGEEVAYYLGKNIAEAKRIVNLSSEHQYIEIGRLSAKLSAEPEKPKTPSNAPAPIKPVGGSSSPSTKKLIDTTDYDEFVKRREKQVAARR